MKKLTCEMCGSTDLMKQDGVFLCQTCGCKYSVEEAKKMMVEGTVEVQGTVTVDQSGELKNLYALARRAREEGNTANAQRYYEQILIRDPDSWEPNFYTVYYQAMNCKIAGIRTEANRLNNNVKTVLTLIQKQEGLDQKAAVTEMGGRVLSAAQTLFYGYMNHYNGISLDIRGNYRGELFSTCSASIDLLYDFANLVSSMFGETLEKTVSVPCWKSGIELQQKLMIHLPKMRKDEGVMSHIHRYTRKIRSYDPTYPDEAYSKLVNQIGKSGMSSEEYANLLSKLQEYNDYPENRENIEKCEQARQKALEEEQKRREIKEQREEKAAQITKKAKPYVLIAVAVVVVALIANLVSQSVASNRMAKQYSTALAYMEDASYAEAIEVFTKLGDYEDSAEQLALAEKLLPIREEYNQATELFEAGKYEEAYAAFLELEEYWDSAAMAETALSCYQAECYEAAVSLMNSGNTAEAAFAFARMGDYEDAGTYCFRLWSQIVSYKTIASDYGNVFALFESGKVGRNGYDRYSESDICDETDIISIAAGEYHIVGLKADGTVVATGSNTYKQTNVTKWSDIVAIDAASTYTIGLKSDGTVLTTGTSSSDTLSVEDWSNMIAIAAGDGHAVGLKADGTVVSTGANDDGQCNVNAWADIAAISAGYSHTVGLKADGTVVATGSNDYGECDVSDWENIVAVSAGRYYTVGLNADGTIVVTGDTENLYGLDLDEWTDIAEIDADRGALLGVKKDGTLVAAGAVYYYNLDSYRTETIADLNLDTWKSVMVP